MKVTFDGTKKSDLRREGARLGMEDFLLKSNRYAVTGHGVACVIWTI